MKKNSGKVCIKAILILVLCAVFVGFLASANEVLLRKEDNRYYILDKELERLDEQYDLQVYGSCHAYSSFNTQWVRDELGITCYNMSNPGETLPVTYLRMYERFKKDTPEVAVVELWGLNPYETYSPASLNLGAYMTTNLERMPLSWEKLKVIADFDTLSFLDENFAAHKYRNRLLEGQLKTLDFNYTYQEARTQYRMQMLWLYDEMDNRLARAGYLSYEPKPVPEYSELQPQIREDDLLPVEEDIMKYVKKIIELCEQYGVELIFYRVPYISTENELRKANYFAAFCEENQVPFWDLEKELQWDYQWDFFDLYHLSRYGAQKTTEFLMDKMKAAFELN